MSATFPPRLHVLLARDAPIGLVIRRGPSKQYATIAWNLTDDTFQLGQWMKGRIYERRSDISPDGKYFIYFAMNGKWSTESQGSWTAISRVPYLKAIGFFPKGDCWHGGGLWTARNRYWINEGYGHQILRPAYGCSRDKKFDPDQYFGGECPGVYYLRLQRDGWTYHKRVVPERRKVYHLFTKPVGNGWTLEKRAREESQRFPGRGCYWDEHRLIGPPGTAAISVPDWEWADIDRNRLVWAANGKLFAGTLRPDGVHDTRLLYDLTPMSFERIMAPY
jgi:hypothetical protein